jgi:hypothetical protein
MPANNPPNTTGSPNLWKISKTLAVNNSIARK